MMKVTKATIQAAWYDTGALHELLFSSDFVSLNAVDTSKAYYLPVVICADSAEQEAFVRREIEGTMYLMERIDLTKDNADLRLAKYQTHEASDLEQAA